MHLDQPLPGAWDARGKQEPAVGFLEVACRAWRRQDLYQMGFILAHLSTGIAEKDTKQQ